MASRPQKMPRSSSSLKIRKAVKHLKAMPMEDRIQLLVEAKLMNQEEADQAKHKLKDVNQSASQPAVPANVGVLSESPVQLGELSPKISHA
jgi:hypothetical protein